MNIIPGDIVLVKDFEYVDGTVDENEYRPCLVIFVDERYEEPKVNVLKLTRQWYRICYYDKQYTIVNINNEEGVASLEYVYEINQEKIHAVVDSVGADYFRIMRGFKKRHNQNYRNHINRCLGKIEFYEENYNFLNSMLKERRKSFQQESKDYWKMEKNREEEDPIAKRLKRKSKTWYLAKKELLDEKIL